MSMQNVEKGRLLEVATKLYLQEQGFKTYFWSEWASQKGLSLQDTGIDLVAEIDTVFIPSLKPLLASVLAKEDLLCSPSPLFY